MLLTNKRTIDYCLRLISIYQTFMNKFLSREMRVFLSSTFRDMDLERNHLIKNVFPRIRQACQERQVGFTDIDLRWGLTEEESKNGATVEICLKEIDRCRDFPPFFIGFIGERYGWVPRHEDLIAYWERHTESPYASPIRDAVKRGISVTELEMELAVLGNTLTAPALTIEDMKDRALFLLREPALSLELYEKAKRKGAIATDFIDAGNGRLEVLKQRIRNSGLLKNENYKSVEEFGEQIESHLMQALDRYFPSAEIPSERERVDTAHAGFRFHRLQNFMPRPDIRKELMAAIVKRANNPKLGPVVLTAPSGQGKSAILADLALYLEENSDHEGTHFQIVDHYIGAGGYPSLEAWAERIMHRLHPQVGDLMGPIPECSNEQVKALSSWITAACHRKTSTLDNQLTRVKYIVVIDALDQLHDQGQDLHVLNFTGIDCIQVLSAANNTPALNSCSQFEFLSISPMDEELRNLMIRGTLARFRKTLPESDVRRLAKAPQCGSPLYLSLALEELRLDAHHENISGLVAEILNSKSPEELFLRNFLLDTDYSRPQQPDLAARFMALMGASAGGLTETQLSELLALDEDPSGHKIEKSYLPRNYLSGLLNNFGNFLLYKGERRSPMHRILGEVAITYIGEKRTREDIVKKFYYEDQPERFYELTHQFVLLKDWKRLSIFLAEDLHLPLTKGISEFDFMRAWKKASAHHDVKSIHLATVTSSPANRIDDTGYYKWWSISYFLGDIDLEKFWIRRWEENVKGENPRFIASKASVLFRSGDINAACALLEKSSILHPDFDNDCDLLTYLCIKGSYKKALMLSDEIKQNYAEGIKNERKKSNNFFHSLYFVFHDLDRNWEAASACERVTESYRRVFDRYNELIMSVNLGDAYWGSGRMNLAEITLLSAYNDAKEAKLDRIVEIAAICLANVLSSAGRHSDAKLLYQEGIELAKNTGNRWDTLYGLAHEALNRIEMGDMSAVQDLDSVESWAKEAGFDYIVMLCKSNLCQAFLSMRTNHCWVKAAVNHCIESTFPSANIYGRAALIHSALLKKINPKSEDLDQLSSSLENVEGLKGRLAYLDSFINKLDIKNLLSSHNQASVAKWRKTFDAG